MKRYAMKFYTLLLIAHNGEVIATDTQDDLQYLLESAIYWSKSIRVNHCNIIVSEVNEDTGEVTQHLIAVLRK